MFHVPENIRLRKGPMASDSSYGNNGAFFLTRGKSTYFIIASDGMGWEHVSIHVEQQPTTGWGKSTNRTPTWSEMGMIKDLFWDEQDCVVQFHPPKSEYVNNHKTTLHLWRSTRQDFPMPDSILVGIK